LPPAVDWYLKERYWYFEQTLFPVNTYWGLFLNYYFKAFTPAQRFDIEVSAPQFVKKNTLIMPSYR